MKEQKKGVIVLGSSRSKGNTAVITDYVLGRTGFDLLNLHDYNIAHFDYHQNYENDDFSDLFTIMANNYHVVIFATPVYWYTMSGRLKVFFDRITDALYHDKPTIDKLAGKKMMVISCGNAEAINEGFHIPFKESAAYLKMDYKGHFHTWLEDGKIPLKVTEQLEHLIQLTK